MRKIFGILAILMTVGIAYFWNARVLDDRYIAIMIAVLGLTMTFAIDIPSLIERRKSK